MERDWGRAGIEMPIEEALADPIVHLVMRRDGLMPADVRAVIDEVRRRHSSGPATTLRPEDPALPSKETPDVPQSIL